MIDSFLAPFKRSGHLYNETIILFSDIFGGTFTVGSTRNWIGPNHRWRDFRGGIMSAIRVRRRYFHGNMRL
jgi:hypothetical protein